MAGRLVKAYYEVHRFNITETTRARRPPERYVPIEECLDDFNESEYDTSSESDDETETETEDDESEDESDEYESDDDYCPV
jgi:hypothetical protein